MIFYTVKEQEFVLDFDYNIKIEEKTKEIKKKNWKQVKFKNIQHMHL